MAPRYHVRERIFVCCGPNLTKSAPVYSVDDLSEHECATLEQCVQRVLDELHEEGEHGPWSFELGPTATEDHVAFINLKAEWAYREPEIAGCKDDPDNSWRGELRWIHGIADEQANVIRGLRESELVTIYLQCDSGRGYRTFACVDTLTEQETFVLEEVLQPILHDMGMMMRLVNDWDAERQPAIHVQASLGWIRMQEDLELEEVDEERADCAAAAEEALEAILKLRQKPVVYGPPDGTEEDEDWLEVTPRNNGNGQAPDATGAPLCTERAADDTLRPTYHDPDNYWRNVWLYERRKAGQTNQAILAELTQQADRYAPLETENALRAAIDQIAQFHGWPLLRGKAGRPRAPRAAGEPPQWIPETPQ